MGDVSHNPNLFPKFSRYSMVLENKISITTSAFDAILFANTDKHLRWIYVVEDPGAFSREAHNNQHVISKGTWHIARMTRE